MRPTILAPSLLASMLQAVVCAAGDDIWISAMAETHERFRGTRGTFAHFGDSITISRAFWSPLSHSPKGLDPAAKRDLDRVQRYQRPECWSKWKGPDYGNDGGRTVRWADEHVDAWLRKLNPEVVLVMFGTNDLVNIGEDEYASRLRRVVEKCLANGSVVLLSTAPPSAEFIEKSRRFAEIVQRLGGELKVPVIAYFEEILRRRPDDWNGALPAFAKTPGDGYQVPTLIGRDGDHPSNPKAYQGYDEGCLNRNGYALRNWMVLRAYAEVIDMVLDAGGGEGLRKSVAFYASFDDEVRGDRGGGQLTPDTRFNHPTEAGKFVFEKGFNKEIFRIAKGKGIAGGALEAVEPLPRNGRIFFPAKGNLPFRAGGWSGAVSMWVNTDPTELIKAPFCDPIQITEKGANNGGLWFDFNNARPRDLRHGAFPAPLEGEAPLKEEDPNAPMVRVPAVAWKAGEWHHVVLTWRNLDTGKPDAVSALYIDGKLIGEVGPRALAMRWDLDKTGLYVAVNFVGLLDEMAIFNRALTGDEVKLLHENPGILTTLKP